MKSPSTNFQVPELLRPEKNENEFVGLIMIGLPDGWSICGFNLLYFALAYEFKRAGIQLIHYGGSLWPSHVAFIMEVQTRAPALEVLVKTVNAWNCLPQTEIAWFDSSELYWRVVHRNGFKDFETLLNLPGQIDMVQRCREFLAAAEELPPEKPEASGDGL